MSHRTERIFGPHILSDPDIDTLQTCQKTMIPIQVFNDQEQAEAAERAGERRHSERRRHRPYPWSPFPM